MGSRKKTETLHKGAGAYSGKDSFSEELLELIVSRRTVRAFQEKPVKKEWLDKLVLAGRMSSQRA